MRVTRLNLRNYRTFEEPLELELPAGLVGVYGPNGAGKSYLVEAIPFALYGTSRTTKDEVRTAGARGECVVEVELEHEGHLYAVRRTVSGALHTVRASACCDGVPMVEGARDTSRYVHSVLGMDDAAFRASVFAEQKQLAAFSRLSPAERRRLVLQLLGVTPLDAARDRARRDAREAEAAVRRAREVLAGLDLDRLHETLAEARAAADAAEREAAAVEAERALAERARREAAEALARAEGLGRTYEELVREGRYLRATLEETERRVERLEAERRELAGLRERLPGLVAAAAGLDEAEARERLVAEAASAAQAVARLEAAVPDEPPPPDGSRRAAAAAAAEAARGRVAALDGRLEAARAALELAAAAAERAAELSGAAHCPLCGQALGEAFREVQQRREEELAAARAAVARLEGERAEASERVRAAAAELAAAEGAQAAAVEARLRYQACTAELAVLRARLEEASAAAEAALGRPPSPGDAERVRAEVGRRREASAEAERAKAILARLPALDEQLAAERAKATGLASQLEALRDKVRGLGFSNRALEAARAALERAEAAERSAAERAQHASVAAAERRARVEALRERLEEAPEARRRLRAEEEDARHLLRTAELLGAFRDAVVATAGPHLAAQAAELFAELTDQEYDRLEVDPETYELKIRDGAGVYGMDRFSGSETDLANLALRVAVSEQVRFQAGGAVGLLVLDEVFGPLDADRTARMLAALERLRGRFRQVLVVTHSVDIKEQLPSAVEVVKRKGRRATARLL
jgi:exonuclease SbcC